ncbi:kinase-like protein [Sporormia fimetaria CBS 119925]|uniref:Kinase-like protein n=1 Tax=Sporormia fimetaria CBS 119925 TaxID=1340428 RepID=A0A6A6VHL5_9PLEO|nr:kinase-like protein [Sporormia fimetaria CBS 119925]
MPEKLDEDSLEGAKPLRSGIDESRWWGASYLGGGTFGHCALFVETDSQDIIINRMAVKDAMPCKLETWLDPKSWSNQPPREIDIHRALEAGRPAGNGGGFKHIVRFFGYRLMMKQRRYRTYLEACDAGDLWDATKHALLEYYDEPRESGLQFHDPEVPEEHERVYDYRLNVKRVLPEHSECAPGTHPDWVPVVHRDIKMNNFLIRVNPLTEEQKSQGKVSVARRNEPKEGGDISDEEWEKAEYNEDEAYWPQGGENSTWQERPAYMQAYPDIMIADFGMVFRNPDDDQTQLTNPEWWYYFDQVTAEGQRDERYQRLSRMLDEGDLEPKYWEDYLSRTYRAPIQAHQHQEAVDAQRGLNYPPEMRRGHSGPPRLSEKTDVWSVGAMMWDYITGTNATWKNRSKECQKARIILGPLTDRIIDNRRVPVGAWEQARYPGTFLGEITDWIMTGGPGQNTQAEDPKARLYSDELKKLVAQCLHIDPDRRPTIHDLQTQINAELRRRNWLEDIDIDDVSDYTTLHDTADFPWIRTSPKRPNTEYAMGSTFEDPKTKRRKTEQQNIRRGKLRKRAKQP